MPAHETVNRLMGPPALSGLGRVALLDADPDLGFGLAERHRRHAREALVVRRVAIAARYWDDGALDHLTRGGLGLLVLDGALARELAMTEYVTTEILGSGDLVAPPGRDVPGRLRSAVRWTELEPTEIAVLDAEAMSVLTAYPSVVTELLGRMAARADRLRVVHAITHLKGIDRRILTLYWHLAERWGRVHADGVHLRLRISHRMAAQLVGARRPTVTTAITNLVRREQLVRLTGGDWLLRGDPVRLPLDHAARVIVPRRRVAHLRSSEKDAG